MNPFRIWWADSRGKVIVILLVLWIGAILTQRSFNAILFPLAAVSAMILLDASVSFLRKHQPVLTLSSVITGLLIGLIFDPTSGIWPLLAACAIASVTKQFVNFGDHRHIFNPAAIGILTASLLLARPVAWWGASWGVVPVIIILGMVPVLYKLRRLWMPLTFLAIYFLSNVLIVSLPSALRLTLDGTLFLFAFIMIPEPMTSVSGNVWRYTWGILIGVLVAVQSIAKINVGDPLLLALIGGNSVGFLFVRLPFFRRSSVQTA